jgi:hypothetical protein
LIHSQIDPGTVIRHHQVDTVKKKKSSIRFLLSKSSFYLCSIEYRLRNFFRSNQSTWRSESLYVQEGTWVQAGDLLADGSASLHGSFSVGQNLLIGYIPWDGLNFEDAIVATENLITKEIFTSTHVEQWETSLQRSFLGIETFVPFSFRLARRIQGRQQEFFADSVIDSNKKLSSIWKKKRFFFFKKLSSQEIWNSKKNSLKTFTLIKQLIVKNKVKKKDPNIDLSILNSSKNKSLWFTNYNLAFFVRKKKKNNSF